MGTETVLPELPILSLAGRYSRDGSDLEAADQDGAAAGPQLPEMPGNELGAQREGCNSLLLPDGDSAELAGGRGVSPTFRTVFRLSDYLTKPSRTELEKDSEDEARAIRAESHERARAERRRVNLYLRIVRESTKASPYFASPFLTLEPECLKS